MPVGVIPGFGGAPAIGSGSKPQFGVAKFNDPKLQAIFDAAIQHIKSNPTGTPTQDLLAGAQAGLSNSNGKGVDWADLPLDARKLELSTQSILAQAGQAQHKSPGLWSRITDIISRPMYAVASATQRAGEDLGTQGFGLHTLGAFAKGAGEGITGENKEDFGKLLQEKVDIDKVKKDHPDWSNSQVLSEVQKNPGQGKNPLLTGLGGLTLDVALDPTSYLGAGGVTKVVKGAEDLSHLSELADHAVAVGAAGSREEALAKLGARVANINGESRIVPQGAAGTAETGSFVKTKDLLSRKQKTAVEQNSLPFLEELAKAKAGSTKVDLGGIADPEMRKIAEDTVLNHLKTFPALNEKLKAVEALSTKEHPAISNELNGTLHLSKNFGDTKFTNGILSAIHATPGYTTVPVHTKQELIKYITTHELGHHVAYALGKQTQKSILKMAAKQFAVEGEPTAKTAARELSIRAAKNPREFLAEAWAEHMLSKNPRPMASMIGKEMEARLAAKTTKADRTLKATTAILQHNLNPETSRALQITMAGHPLLHIPTERLAQTVTDATHGDNTIGKVVNKYEELFRSRKGVDPIFHNMNLSANGVAQEANRSKVSKLRAVYGKMDPATRKRVLMAYRSGVKSLPVEGSNGVNALTHFREEVARIQSGVYSMQDLRDLNRFLPSNWKIDSEILRKRSLSPDWLEEHIKETLAGRRGPGGKVIKELNDPGQVLFMFDHALEKMDAHQSLWKSIAHGFGHETLDREGKIRAGVKAFKSQGYREATYKDSFGKKHALPYTKGHVFHPEVAAGLEKFHTILHSPKTYQDGAYNIIQMMKPATQAFKSLVTKWNPGFHERNLIGEVMASTMAGVTNPTVYRRAATVLYQFGQDYRKEGEKIGDARARQILDKQVPLTGKTIKVNRQYRLPNGVVTDQIPVDLVMDLYKRNGLRTGWYSEFDNIIGSGNMAQRVMGHANQFVQHGTEQIEDFARMSHFIDTLDKFEPMNKGAANLEKAAEEGSLTVRKYHFDYTDFTPFEKNVMSTIFPFYKWTRKNIPMQIEMLLTHPGRVSAIPKTESALSRMLGYTNSNNSDTYLPGADSIVPDFLRVNGAFPVGTAPTGNTRYLDPAIPTVQGFTALQPGNLPVGGWLGKLPIPGLDTAETMATPYLKVPFELGTGRKLGGGLVSDSNKYAAGMTPYSNLLYSLMSRKPGDPGTAGGTLNNTKLIQFLAGIGLQENTPAYMQSQAKRDQQVASAIRKAYEKKHGTFHSTNHPGVK